MNASLSAPRRPVRWVFFDVGGTLLRVRPSVGTVYAEVARAHGIEADPSRLDIRFRVAWRASLARGHERGHRVTDAILRAEWSNIVAETFGRDCPPERLSALFDDLYERFVSAEPWTLAEGAVASLELLGGRGVRLGVLSNWDARLPRTLAELGIDGVFDLAVISHEVGCEKPHRGIFEEACRRATARPEEILHVGDSLEADIRPARALGWRTLWLAPDAERARAGDAGPGASSLAALDKASWDALLSA